MGSYEKMLSIDDFKKISLDDKPIFDKHYTKYPPMHSDNVFTTLISWKDYGKYCYTLYKDNLVILSRINDKTQLRAPIGKKDKTIFEEILKLAKKQDSEYPFGLITEDTNEWMNNNYVDIKLNYRREYSDYVYLSSDLSELSGSSYSKIRNRLNKFKIFFKYTVETINDSNMDEVKKFLKRWCLWRDCESDIILENEKKAILYSMDHFFDLKLSGISIIVNGNIKAIAVYEQINSDTAIVHYEKGSPYYDGIYKAVNQETAKILKKDYKYINRESDMGLTGLRKAKMSYRPHHLVKVYDIEKEKINL